MTQITKASYDRLLSTRKNIRIPDDLLADIYEQTTTGEFSAWVIDACKSKLRNGKHVTSKK